MKEKNSHDLQLRKNNDKIEGKKGGTRGHARSPPSAVSMFNAAWRTSDAEPLSLINFILHPHADSTLSYVP